MKNLHLNYLLKVIAELEFRFDCGMNEFITIDYNSNSKIKYQEYVICMCNKTPIQQNLQDSAFLFNPLRTELNVNDLGHIMK